MFYDVHQNAGTISPDRPQLFFQILISFSFTIILQWNTIIIIPAVETVLFNHWRICQNSHNESKQDSLFILARIGNDLLYSICWWASDTQYISAWANIAYTFKGSNVIIIDVNYVTTEKYFCNVQWRKDEKTLGDFTEHMQEAEIWK